MHACSIQNCTEKENVLVPEYNQKITLSRGYAHSGCHKVKSSNGKYELNCGGNVALNLMRMY